MNSSTNLQGDMAISVILLEKGTTSVILKSALVNHIKKQAKFGQASKGIGH